MVPMNENGAVAKTDEAQEPERKQKKNWRNLAAYWILGLCNNYGYVVMLSAANDILHEGEESSTDSVIPSIANGTYAGDTKRDCNILSTGVCVLLAAGGFLVVAFNTGQWMSIMGVVLTSLASGLGEVTFLQYSSFYDKDVVSTWSSGTGGAGIFGAVSYAALNKLGLRNALLLMLIVPVLMAVTFWTILMKPEIKAGHADAEELQQEEISDPKGALMKKVTKIPGLLKYMIPLGLVYLFEYFINQGMFELINFENIFIDSKEQYRWLQVDYQIGVFISRSSVNLFHVKRIWLMAVFQFLNVIIFTTEAIYWYIPSFYIVLALTLWEGLLGGAAYVNTFYKISSSDMPDDERLFSMGVTSFADAIGITFAGVFSLMVHNAICELPKPERL